jgi:FdhD protein
MLYAVATELTHYRSGSDPEPRDDFLAAEEPLEIRVEGHSIAVVMRTPGHDRELAAGFLLTEGLINSTRDVFDIVTCVDAGAAGKGNAVDVALARPAEFDYAKLTRHVFTSSSCGICSKASIDAVMRQRAALTDKFQIDTELLLSLPSRLSAGQETFHRTGGLHACALFNQHGELMELREDIGRHNALDKIIGHALLDNRTPLREHIVLLSGRASFEMMQKAHAGGVAVVAAISAPSSLAVQFARESGQTLVGFVRETSLNVYAGSDRLIFPKNKTPAAG